MCHAAPNAGAGFRQYLLTLPWSPSDLDLVVPWPQDYCHLATQLPLTPPTTPPTTPPRCSPTAPPPVVRAASIPPEARLGTIVAERLRFVSILGTGAYGVVYSAVDIHDQTRYAVKMLSKFNADGSPLDHRQVMFQAREIHLHWHASAHPNVVGMHRIIENEDCLFVILEYCPEGDLFYNITECGQYIGDDARAKHVFLQLLDAVSYCHSRGIYHRDLKPENVLVTDHGNTVKLADFGLATYAVTSADYGCGSTFYMSPECLEQHTTHKSSYLCAPNDVWSLGVILVNLTCGRNPWKQASFEDSIYRAFTRNPEFLKTILPVSDELNHILGRIFTRDPARRITMPELVEAIRTCPRFTGPAPLPQETLPSPAASYVPEPWTDFTPAVHEPALGGLSPLDTFSRTFYSSPSSPRSDSSDDDETASVSSTSSTNSIGSLDGLDRSDVDMDDASGCQAKMSPPLLQAPLPHDPYDTRPEEYVSQTHLHPQSCSLQMNFSRLSVATTPVVRSLKQQQYGYPAPGYCQPSQLLNNWLQRINYPFPAQFSFPGHVC